MFTVLNNNEEYLINDIQSSSITEQISDVPELDMIVVNREGNPVYAYLVEEALLDVNGHYWRIGALSERPHYKTIKALHEIIDLDEMPFNVSLTGVYSASALFELIFADTPFELTVDETDLEEVELSEFGLTTKWEAFTEARKLFGVEYRVLPNRHVHIAKQVSTERDEQIRYGHTIRSLVKKTDSTEIVTHVIVNYGEEYEKTSISISPSASHYNRPYYKVLNDSRIENVEVAQKKAAEHFKDISISYELDCIATSKKYELGEYVYTIYEPLNDLSIVTRVQKTKYVWNGEEYLLETVTVGNDAFKTEGEIIQEQLSKSKNEADEKLDEAKKSLTIRFDEKIEQTEANITEEYSAAITISAQQIRADLTAAVTTINGNITTIENNVSSVTQTANQLSSTVSNHTTTLNGYGTRISSAESSIIQNANSISQKVSQSDYNGNMISSLINQTATTIQIQASKINLVGAVSVLSDISGNLGTITAGTINIATDIRAGNNLYLGQMGGGEKSIYFNNSTYIKGGTGWINEGINMHADEIAVDASTFDLTDVNYNRGYLKSFTDGLEITRSTTNPTTLIVKLYGSMIGSIPLS